MMNGFLNLYKPKGISSAKLLNSIKRAVNGAAIGHMGTLDPLASGVLPVGIGKSTRLFDYLLDKDKVYEAVFAFGYETNTLDLEGKVVKRTDIVPTEEEIKEKLQELVGDILQTPPAYSAKCVNGKRSYQLARNGVGVTLTPKRVTVISIEYIGKRADDEYKFRIVCKGGTYIRSIARDLAALCGTVATMTDLVRTASGVFNIEDSVTVEEFLASENPSGYIVAPDSAFSLPAVYISDKEANRLFNGLYDRFSFPNGLCKIYSPNGFYGVGEVRDGIMRVRAYIEDEGYRLQQKKQ